MKNTSTGRSKGKVVVLNEDVEAVLNEDVEATRVIARFISIRNSYRIFLSFLNCSTFYACKEVLSSQTSVCSYRVLVN